MQGRSRFDEIADFWWIAPRRVVYSVGKKFADLETPLLTGELYAANADSSDVPVFGSHGSQLGPSLMGSSAPLGT